MKKFLSIVLCAVMVLCAVSPCFAADNKLTSFGDSSPFNKGWVVIEKSAPDYADEQTVLFNNTDYWPANGGPNYNVAGFSAGETYVTLWGGTNATTIPQIWAEKPTYDIPFYIAEDGLYSFAFMMDCGGDAGATVPVRVDDGEWYNVVIDGAYRGYATTYYGMNNIELSAGEHVFSFSRAVGTEKSQYYYGVKITGEKLVEEVIPEPEEPVIDYNLKMSANLASQFSGATFVPVTELDEELNEGVTVTPYTDYPNAALNGSAALGNPKHVYKYVINVKRSGDYIFAFEFSAGGTGRGFSSITIDGEGTPYTATSTGSIPFPQHEYYTGMKVTLTKGEHVVCLTPTQGTPYFHGFYYGIEEAYVDPTLKATAFLPSEYAKASYIHAADMLPYGENGDLTWGVYENSQWALLDGAVTLSTQDTYRIPFKAPVTGTYRFAMVFSAGGANRGLQSITVDGRTASFNAISDGKVGFPQHEYFPGMQVYLEEGTHMLEISRTASMPYFRGFYFYCYEIDADVGSDEAGDGEILATPTNPIPNTSDAPAAPAVPGESVEPALQNLITPAPATDVPESKPAESQPTPPQPNGGDAAVPALPGGDSVSQWLPALPALSAR